MVRKLNDIFGFFVLTQYVISSTVISITVYVCAEVQHFDAHCAMLIAYTVCLLGQIYLFCSAGDEITTQVNEKL